MSTWLSETYRDRNKHTEKRMVRQVGYLQRLHYTCQMADDRINKKKLERLPF
jgi:hypothetical protein